MNLEFDDCFEKDFLKIKDKNVRDMVLQKIEEINEGSILKIYLM